MSNRSRKPRKAVETSGARQPAAAGRGAGLRVPAAAALQPSPDRIRFRFDRVDLGGPWCLTAITSDDHRVLLEKMREFERLTMAEAFNGQLGKDYHDLSKCPNPTVLRRLQDIEMDDIDALSRFRLSGTRRLYGTRLGNEFSILWWDPNHEVWPSTLKHT